VKRKRDAFGKIAGVLSDAERLRSLADKGLKHARDDRCEIRNWPTVAVVMLGGIADALAFSSQASSTKL
jgi:hypothetical protein